MPVHTNSIGEHIFDALRGEIVLRSEQLEIIERVGVSGSGVRKIGRRGKPFTLASEVFGVDWDYAKQVQESYLELKGSDPVQVIKNSVNYGTFLVLDVVLNPTIPVFNVAGDVAILPSVIDGTYPGIEVLILAQWTLLG